MTGSVDPGYLMFSISSSLPPLFELKYTNEFFSFSMLIWWHGIRYTAEANDTKPCWVCFCCTFVVQSRSFWFSLQIFTFYLYSDTKARHTHSHRMIAYNVTSKKKNIPVTSIVWLKCILHCIDIHYLMNGQNTLVCLAR